MKKLLLTIIIMTLSTSCHGQSKVDLTPVSKFDLNQYLGLWYEIARYENRFERAMTNPTAHYTLLDNGMVRVENSADLNGKRKTAIGKAKLDKSSTPGCLQVAFFLNFYAPYRVLMVDKDYNYALVASGEKYLWILSRLPQLDENTLINILSEARDRGFDTNKLIYTQTKKDCQ